MEINRTGIRSSANAFDNERHTLGVHAAQARKELEAIGNFWGGSKEGTTFLKGEGGASGYEAVTGQIMEGVDVFREAHHEIAERLRLMADLVRVGDWDSVTDLLSRLPAADPNRKIWGTS
ncbi:hypothetical protein [Nonomuraea zeae]|uniref:WXG100 family type VII secretion target n=1 Tax=Nonomuraea zeae TaxID=1642303 RepID=A0A5S4GPJ1_9ACTN|nr:hypothetical protein [Nonomuraea zeae]TMR28280.1 hypothetical protein ETD85_36295 [Nonomuraea zeae]